jgi:hypothetical protein
MPNTVKIGRERQLNIIYAAIDRCDLRKYVEVDYRGSGNVALYWRDPDGFKLGRRCSLSAMATRLARVMNAHEFWEKLKTKEKQK